MYQFATYAYIALDIGQLHILVLPILSGSIALKKVGHWTMADLLCRLDGAC